MDSAINASDLHGPSSASAVAAPAAARDDLAFFQALWFWIPAALALWSALIWGLTRIV